MAEEKRKRILDACIEEFATKGYEGASTNEIVVKAGISKGILFHYFGSKKNLYLYVIDHAIDYTINKYYSEVEKLPDDLVERVMYRGRQKIRIAAEEPYLYELVYRAFVNTPEDLKEELQARYDRIYDLEAVHFFTDIDTAKFRDDIDPQDAYEMILLFARGIFVGYLDRFKAVSAEESFKYMDELMHKTEVFMEILKKGIYK